MSEDTLRLAIAQMTSGPDVDRNLEQVAMLARQAADAGADLLMLPENATLLAPTAERIAGAEPVDGTQINFCSDLASALGIGILVGSFSELSDDPYRTYNTSVLLDRGGKVTATYRKVHLFDVDVDADTRFRESASTVAGDPQPVVATFDGWRLGLSVCYDLRFPELYRALVAGGAEVLTVPAAFTFRTGAAHWEVLLRARAIENLCWVAAPAQVGVPYAGRESWGHALVVSPWGDVVGQVSAPEVGLTVVDVRRQEQRAARSRIPSLDHRRM